MRQGGIRDVRIQEVYLRTSAIEAALVAARNHHDGGLHADPETLARMHGQACRQQETGFRRVLQLIESASRPCDAVRPLDPHSGWRIETVGE